LKDLKGYILKQSKMKEGEELTKRDWFAGMALQGLVIDGELPFEKTAKWAVLAADQLIWALENTEDPNKDEI
jgi:hypothetical protein